MEVEGRPREQGKWVESSEVSNLFSAPSIKGSSIDLYGATYGLLRAVSELVRRKMDERVMADIFFKEQGARTTNMATLD